MTSCPEEKAPRLLLASNWAVQLFTHEDPFHVHKILGLSVLLSYAWRLLTLVTTSGRHSDLGFASHPHLTIPTLLLHLALNLSSFVFRIPQRRIKSDGGRIWPEFRLHSLVFLSRSLSNIAINWYERYYTDIADEPVYVRNLWVVLASMAAADLASYSVGSDGHSRSIRDLSAPASVKFYFSIMQFYATSSILFGSRRCSLYFFQALVIQVTAFLLTLRRRNLVTHGCNVVLYGSLLAGAVAIGFLEFAVPIEVHQDGNQQQRLDPTPYWIVSLIACTAAIWRMRLWWPTWMSPMSNNKYLIWSVMYIVLNHGLRPVLVDNGVDATTSTLLENRSNNIENVWIIKESVRWLALAEIAVIIWYGFYLHQQEQVLRRRKNGI